MHQGAHRAAARRARREDFGQALGRDAADGVDGKRCRSGGFAQKAEAARRQARLAGGLIDVARDEIRAAELFRFAHVFERMARS